MAAESLVRRGNLEEWRQQMFLQMFVLWGLPECGVRSKGGGAGAGRAELEA